MKNYNAMYGSRDYIIPNPEEMLDQIADTLRETIRNMPVGTSITIERNSNSFDGRLYTLTVPTLDQRSPWRQFLSTLLP